METMEFPLTGLAEVRSSDAGVGGSLYSRRPAVATPYIGVLGLAAVVGTLGNLVVITTVTTKYLLSPWRRAETTVNDGGWVFIANLVLSDLIVTAVINPLAIAGMSVN